MPFITSWEWLPSRLLRTSCGEDGMGRESGRSSAARSVCFCLANCHGWDVESRLRRIGLLEARDVAAIGCGGAASGLELYGWKNDEISSLILPMLPRIYAICTM